MKNIEIERKFLVINDSYRALAVEKKEIRQGYLCRDNARVVRIRIQDDNAFITIKSARGALTNFEWEHAIDRADAEELLALCLPGIIHKTRWIVPAENNLKWEIDEFHNHKDHLTLAEIELPTPETPFNKPSFIGEEVTGQPQYYNANMEIV